MLCAAFGRNNNNNNRLHMICGPPKYWSDCKEVRRIGLPTQILGFNLICLYFTTGHSHSCELLSYVVINNPQKMRHRSFELVSTTIPSSPSTDDIVLAAAYRCRCCLDSVCLLATSVSWPVAAQKRLNRSRRVVDSWGQINHALSGGWGLKPHGKRQFWETYFGTQRNGSSRPIWSRPIWSMS